MSRRGLALAPATLALTLAALAASPLPGNAADDAAGTPRTATLTATEANLRAGPSDRHRILWVYRRRGLPVEVLGESGDYLRVRLPDGAGGFDEGWLFRRLVGRAEAGLVTVPQAALRARPTADSPPVAWARAQVIVRVRRCAGGWCQAEAGGYVGWIAREALWGAPTEE